MGVTVIYRLCDINSTNPSPLYPDDRPALNRVCLESFVKAFKDTDISVHFLCDNTDTYDEYLKQTVPFPYTTEYSNAGINYSYLKSLAIGLESKQDVFFLECDYLFKPGIGNVFLEAIKEFDFISPYDHPDKYPGTAELALFGGYHWRTAISTTMTFAARYEHLERYYDLLTKHGYLDHQMWTELQETTGKKLWTPLPGMATHMVADYLSPNCDWLRTSE